MSELYAFLRDRNPLEQAMVYSVIKKVDARDVNNNRDNNKIKKIKNAINDRCEELGLESLKQEIYQKIISLESSFHRERKNLDKKVGRELIEKNIVEAIAGGPPNFYVSFKTVARY